MEAATAGAPSIEHYDIVISADDVDLNAEYPLDMSLDDTLGLAEQRPPSPLKRSASEFSETHPAKRIKAEPEEDDHGGAIPAQVPEPAAAPRLRPRGPLAILEEPKELPEAPLNHMKGMNLQFLGFHTVHLIECIVTMPPEAVGDPNSEDYCTFKSVIPQLQMHWSSMSDSRNDDLLIWEKLGLPDSTQKRRTVRWANLARFGADLFSGDRSRLRALNERFFKVFVYGLRKFAQEESDILLELKTQAAVSLLENRDEQSKPVDAVLQEVLLDGLQDALKERACAWDEPYFCLEQDTIAAAEARKKEMLREWEECGQDGKALAAKHPVAMLLQRISQYMANEVASSPEVYDVNHLPTSAKKITVENSKRSTANDWTRPEHDNDDFWDTVPHPVIEDNRSGWRGLDADGQQRKMAALAGGGNSTDVEWMQICRRILQGANHTISEHHRRQAELAQLAALQRGTMMDNGANSASQTPYSNANQPASNPQATPEEYMLPPGQSRPTQELFEMARASAASKSSSSGRRGEGAHSTRRPWTQDEEAALMDGLDRVRGPHWSQILSLYGLNGTISDVLKDRTQVQLKDKARNLKLFFLKQNVDMPHYLKQVTGELKTRAPNQAAKKERQEEEAKAQAQAQAYLPQASQSFQSSQASQATAKSSAPIPPLSSQSIASTSPELPRPVVTTAQALQATQITTPAMASGHQSAQRMPAPTPTLQPAAAGASTPTLQPQPSGLTRMATPTRATPPQFPTTMPQQPPQMPPGPATLSASSPEIPASGPTPSPAPAFAPTQAETTATAPAPTPIHAQAQGQARHLTTTAHTASPPVPTQMQTQSQPSGQEQTLAPAFVQGAPPVARQSQEKTPTPTTAKVSTPPVSAPTASASAVPTGTGDFTALFTRVAGLGPEALEKLRAAHAATVQQRQQQADGSS